MAARKPTKKKLQSGQSLDEKEKTPSDELELWRGRVKHAKKVRKDWEAEYQVQECENFFLGKQHGKNTSRNSETVFNRFRATLRAQKPALFYANPKFFVRPKPGINAPVEETHASIGEAVLEAIGGNDNCLKNAASMALWQSFFRLGIIKTCYDPKLEPNPQQGDPIYVQGPEGPVMDANGQPVQLIDPLTGLPVVEPAEVLDDEVYTYEYVDSKCMLLPDDGPDMSKWTWIGEEITVLLSDAKEDTRWSESMRLHFESNVETGSDESRTNRRIQDTTNELDRKFKYYECYDIRKKRLLIWADGQETDEFLSNDLFPSGIEDHPYSLLNLGDPILGPLPSPWPVPYTYSWLDIQREYNTNRKQIQNAAKRSSRKIYYDESTFAGPDEIDKATSPDDMVFVKLNSVDRPPICLAEPALGSDVLKAVSLLDMDWRMITGTTGARAGTGDANTATEARIVESNANVRQTDMQDAVSDWLSSAGKKMLQLVSKTLTMDLWVKLRGWGDSEFTRALEAATGLPPSALALLDQALPGLKEALKERVGSEQWKSVTREELTFEADVTVQPGSARPRNLDTEREAWMSFLTLLGQFPQLAFSLELLKETAKKFDGMISDRMVEELNALAMQMVGAQTQVAGHGGENDAAGSGDGSKTAGKPDLTALVGGIK